MRAVKKLVVSRIACASCQARYAAEDIEIFARRDYVLYLRCVCHVCHIQGIGLVYVLDLRDATVDSGEPALTLDDVLTAHEFLERDQVHVDDLWPRPSAS